MNEYTAGLQDVKDAYVYDSPAAAYDLDIRANRERAFDRLIRAIEDEAYEEGHHSARWEYGNE